MPRRFACILSVLCIVLCGLRVFADQAVDAGVLMQIRVKLQSIDASLERYQRYEKEYYLPGGYGYLDSYHENGEIRKIVDVFDGDGASGVRECYFWEGELILVLKRWQTYQLWPSQMLSDVGVTEEEYYYQDGRLVKWLITTKREIDPRNEQYLTAEDDIGGEVHELVRFLESDYQDYERFQEEEPSLIDWASLANEGEIDSLPVDVLLYLQTLEASIEAHDWQTVLHMALRQHYDIQVGEIGLTHDAYVKELIGLGIVGNTIEPARDAASQYPSCDRISEVTFEGWQKQRRTLVIRGTVIDNAGNRLKLRIELLSKFHGIYMTGPVG